VRVPSQQHIEEFCKPKINNASCVFFELTPDGPQCMKNSPRFHDVCEAKLLHDGDGPKGDNCSGPPDFAPITSIA
jgi:hypothetical protein